MWLSILFSVVLAGTQTVLTVEPGSPLRDAAKCVCRNCSPSPSPCCACAGAPASPSAPLTPARTIMRTEAQWVITASTLPDPAPASFTPNFSPSDASSFLMGRVPLYQRDCTYLI